MIRSRLGSICDTLRIRRVCMLPEMVSDHDHDVLFMDSTKKNCFYFLRFLYWTTTILSLPLHRSLHLSAITPVFTLIITSRYHVSMVLCAIITDAPTRTIRRKSTTAGWRLQRRSERRSRRQTESQFERQPWTESAQRNTDKNCTPPGWLLWRGIRAQVDPKLEKSAQMGKRKN